MVTAPTSPFVKITATDVKLYFKNSGPQTVSIPDGDMCVPSAGAWRSNPGDYRYGAGGVRGYNGDNTDMAYFGKGSRPADNWRLGDQVTSYWVQTGAYKSADAFGVFDSAANCRTKSVPLRVNIPVSSLDASIGYYVAVFHAQTMPVGTNGGDSGAQNVFNVQLANRNDVVGYDSTVSSHSFGILNQNPRNGISRHYSNWNVRFGSPCDLAAPTTVSAYTYDDDNGGQGVQNTPMWNELQAYKPDGTFAGDVPLKWYWHDPSGAWVPITVGGARLDGGTVYVQSARADSGDANSYYAFSGSENDLRVTFTATPLYKYNWYWHGVYFNNTMDFRLPFDTIYAKVACQSNIVPQCADMSTNPAIVDPDSTFKIRAAVDYDNLTDAQAVISGGSKMKIQVTGPGVAYSDANISITDPNIDNEVVGISASIGPSNASGRYTVTWSVVGPVGSGPSPPCSATFDIAFLPFFSVKGGDVSAGAKMGVGGVECATAQDDDAGVVSWNQEQPSYIGAGTQYAAFAMNFLQDFATAQGTGAQQPTGLSFANTTNVDTGGIGEDTYGGNLVSEPCIPDYFSGHPTNPTHTPTPPPYTFNNGIDLALSGVSKSVYVDGNTVIDNPISVPYGSHTIVYVKGDVQINKNITFGTNFSGGVTDIPSFTIIAAGDILVAPNVDEIDGWYIAQPSTASDTNGIFYSCASNFTATTLNRSLYNTCKTQLNVYGSVVARQVWLGRTFGSLYTNTKAEQFFFDPEVWLGSPLGENAAGTNYDSIESMPPAL